MTLAESVRTCLSKFTTWQGRASRSEYWFFVLFNFIVLVGAAILDNVLGLTYNFTNPATGMTQSVGYGWLYVIGVLVLLLPNLAVLVRRLHDTNRSGWWYWIVLVPFIGAILLLVWFCSRGTAGDNKYGSDPLANAAKAAA